MFISYNTQSTIAHDGNTERWGGWSIGQVPLDLSLSRSFFGKKLFFIALELCVKYYFVTRSSDYTGAIGKYLRVCVRGRVWTSRFRCRSTLPMLLTQFFAKHVPYGTHRGLFAVIAAKSQGIPLSLPLHLVTFNSKEKILQSLIKISPMTSTIANIGVRRLHLAVSDFIEAHDNSWWWSSTYFRIPSEEIGQHFCIIYVCRGARW